MRGGQGSEEVKLGTSHTGAWKHAEAEGVDRVLLGRRILMGYLNKAECRSQGVGQAGRHSSMQARQRGGESGFTSRMGLLWPV